MDAGTSPQNGTCDDKTGSPQSPAGHVSVTTVESLSVESDSKGLVCKLMVEESTARSIAVKFALILSVGIILYGIATINVWCFLTLSAILPAILMIIDLFIYKIFIDKLHSMPILRVKYITFVIQNVALVLVYFYGTDSAMSHAITWIYRINIFEVLADAVVNKWIGMWIPSIMLLLPIYSSDLSSFPTFGMSARESNYQN